MRVQDKADPAAEVIIVGAGICGLALALELGARNIACRVFERAPRIRELGVGITLLPHAMREFAALGLDAAIARAGIENRWSAFYNRFGQRIYREPRGSFAGYAVPEIGIHRGRLQAILHEAAQARLPGRIHVDHECIGVAQDESGASVVFRETSSGRPLGAARGRAVVACDGVNSAVRKQLHPDDSLSFAGINTWRGVTRHPPILDGRTYLRIGSILTGKMVIYPIVDNVDGRGYQLVNWVAEIKQDAFERNDWNRRGSPDDFLPIYAGWTFDWLDVPALIRGADSILEYPMVDKDPLDRWTFGRVTLAGDAAHPMYPRGSNGAAQAVIDARVLADCLERHADVGAALRAYEDERLPITSRIVRTNRAFPPDFINIKVEELVGDRPFDDLDRYITQAQLQALSDEYKRVAGFALDNPGKRGDDASN